MAREQDVRRARDAMVRARIEHERKQGREPDTRKAETWATEIARRNDRRESEKK
jgi:hypothetical protein